MATLTEHQMQQAIFAEIAYRANQDERWRYIFAVPNGQYRPGQRMEAGLNAGVPDILWLLPSRGYHGLALELKVGRGKPTSLQDEWLLWLRKHNYLVRVMYDWPEAVIEFLDWYSDPSKEMT